MNQVLILGERGTGKETVARAIHFSSERRDRPFVAVNCREPGGTFGICEVAEPHKRVLIGFDTDLRASFESAEGGTLFLDEIANLTYENQANLLRTIELDAASTRIIASTRYSLFTAVENGKFRQDLHEAIGEITVIIPPLRERMEDLRVLLDHFVAHFSTEMNARHPGFSPSTMDAMLRYPWPGNVRELKSLVELSFIVPGGAALARIEGSTSRPANRINVGPQVNLRSALRAFERAHIADALRQANGNKIEAAKSLGIGLSSLYRKLDELGITNGSHEPSSAN